MLDLVQQIETGNTKSTCLDHIDIGSVGENDIRKYGTTLVNWARSGCIWSLAPESMLTLSSYMTMGNGWGVGSPLQTALTYVILVLVGGTVKVALALAVEAGGVELVAAVKVELLLIVPLPLPLLLPLPLPLPLPALPLPALPL